MRNPLLILVAGVIGLVAAGFLWMQGRNDDADGRTIVVAAATIEPGVAIKAEQLREEAWGLPSLPEGGFVSSAQIVGRVPRVEIGLGQPVVASALAPPNAPGGLTSLIGEGRRAIAIQSDEVSGVAGFVAPGNLVDVMVGGRDANGMPFSKIVLQRVKVLAVQQETKADPAEPRVVSALTLELTPEQAEQLDLARSLGKLSVVLRNQFDVKPVVSRGARMGDILPGSAATVSTPAAPPSAPADSRSPQQGQAQQQPGAAVAPRPSAERRQRGVEQLCGTGACE